MANLYSINIKYALLIEAIEENDGEFTEEIEAEFAELNEDRDEFLNNMCKHIKNKMANNELIKKEAEILDEELSRIKARSKVNSNHIEKIKHNMIKLMEFLDMKNPKKGSTNYTFKTALFSGNTRVTESVQVDPILLSEIPVEHLNDDITTFNVGISFNKEIALGILEKISIKEQHITKEVDKKKLKALIKEINEIGIDIIGKENVDPLYNISDIVSKTSLTIK